MQSKLLLPSTQYSALSFINVHRGRGLFSRGIFFSDAASTVRAPGDLTLYRSDLYKAELTSKSGVGVEGRDGTGVVGKDADMMIVDNY
jgi:hypothetical protein